MKPIRIKHFLRLPILIKLAVALVLFVGLSLLIFGIAEAVPAFIGLGAIFTSVLAIGMGFYLNYGMKITPKRVTVIYHDMIRVLSYDKISYIEIIIRNDVICGEIKTKDQQLHSFCFSDFELDIRAPVLTNVNVKLSRKFVDKAVAKLARYDKVKIRNYYKNSETV